MAIDPCLCAEGDAGYVCTDGKAEVPHGGRWQICQYATATKQKVLGLRGDVCRIVGVLTGVRTRDGRRDNRWRHVAFVFVSTLRRVVFLSFY